MATTTPLVTPPLVPTTSPTNVGISSSPPSSSPTITTPASPTPTPVPSTSPTTSPTVSTSPVISSSSSSSSSSTSSSVPPSTTSASSSSTTSSSTSSTTTSSTSKSISSATSVPPVLQTSNGQVYTLTSVVTESSSPTPAPKSQSSSNSFFHNKGAVAGVFSVVGVVAIVLAFFLFTSYLRRRRAREFDREIDEAAAAAAAARPPDFDDYDFNSAGGYGHHSETSHGTLSQPPLSHDQARGVGDGSYDPYAGAGVTGAGAAGIGARGRSLRNGGQQNPYGAFANPPPEQYEMYETGRGLQQGNPRGVMGVVGAGGPDYDILQAAGLASSDPYAVTRGPSTRTGSYGHSQSGASGLTRSQSQGTSTLPTTAEGYPMPMPTPAPGYPGGQDAAYVPDEKSRYSALYAPSGGISTMPPDEDDDPYDGYQEQPSETLDNPHSPRFAVSREDADVDQNVCAPYAQEHEEAARASFADDEDYGYNSGQRVLRVANE